MKILSKFLILLSAVVSVSTSALEPIYTTFFSNTAIKGYDSVAYFTVGKPVQGKPEFAVEHQGAEWLFSSQENLDLFKQDPAKYAPQYGGYCAWAVSQNKTASAEPDLFTIVDGKLYLNYSKSVNQKWLADKNSFIIAADNNWPVLSN